jgi:hypothetical protein
MPEANCLRKNDRHVRDLDDFRRPSWLGKQVVVRIDQLVAWSMRVIDFDKLRGLADEVRSFIQMSDDKALALRAVIAGHDVVLGIFPSHEEGVGLHVIKGNELLRQIANSNEAGDYTHTAIAVHNLEQAVTLRELMA